MLKHGVPSLRRRFREIAEEMTVDENNCLFIGEKEIGLVYWRTGYNAG